MRKTFLIALVAVLIIVITGGYLACTYLPSQNQTSLQTTSQPKTLSTIDEIRDGAMLYLAANHTQTIPFMSDLSWSGGKMDMGMMVGSDKYNYQSNGWNVTMQNSVVPNPIYTITAEYSPVNMHSAMMTWEGRLQNGTIT